MTTYTFNYGMGDAVRDQMAAVTRQLQNELETMHAQVMTTLRDWEDDAKNEYMLRKTDWDNRAKAMPNSLAQAEMALNEISAGYLKVEHTGRNLWGGYSMK